MSQPGFIVVRPEDEHGVKDAPPAARTEAIPRSRIQRTKRVYPVVPSAAVVVGPG